MMAGSACLHVTTGIVGCAVPTSYRTAHSFKIQEQFWGGSGWSSRAGVRPREQHNAPLMKTLPPP